MDMENTGNTSSIFSVLKHRLKHQGLKYRDLAKILKVSEITVKRWFSQENLTLKQLNAIAQALNTTTANVIQEADQPPPRHLTPEQEQELMNDVRLMLVASCVLSHWSLDDIVKHYNLAEAECVKYLTVLDRLRLIDLLPQNHIQLRVARDFEALPNGPLWKFIRSEVPQLFFKSWPTDQYQNVVIMRAMLTPDAIQQFEDQVQQLRQKVHELHMKSLNATLEQRRSYVACLGHREWELEAFSRLRRTPSR